MCVTRPCWRLSTATIQQRTCRDRAPSHCRKWSLEVINWHARSREGQIEGRRDSDPFGPRRGKLLSLSKSIWCTAPDSLLLGPPSTVCQSPLQINTQLLCLGIRRKGSLSPSPRILVRGGGGWGGGRPPWRDRGEKGTAERRGGTNGRTDGGGGSTCWRGLEQ